jgi:hypothetical protein
MKPPSRMARGKAGYVDGVRDRLRWWYEKRRREAPAKYGNHVTAARTLGMNRTTLRGWLAPCAKRKKPPVPNLRAMIELAEKERLSPTWLLLGVGPEFLADQGSQHELIEQIRVYSLDRVRRRAPMNAETAGRVVPAPELLLARLNTVIDDSTGVLLTAILQLPQRHRGGFVPARRVR